MEGCRVAKENVGVKSADRGKRGHPGRNCEIREYSRASGRLPDGECNEEHVCKLKSQGGDSRCICPPRLSFKIPSKCLTKKIKFFDYILVRT
jgi:hypothetical protein